MCGIAGIIESRLKNNQWMEILRSMTNSLIHRGPDNKGFWFDINAGIGFGHRRLSILDLSKKGHQPMISKSGRYVIVYNGEVYNFLLLRKELEDIGHNFYGRSDTEVMLSAIEEWGLERAIKRFNGMFAFALWDCESRDLYLVRDRIGEKPLYYGWSGRTFLFGSELKSLRAFPDFIADIDRDVLALYLRFSYVPAPYSIYKGIYKLLPGTILKIKGNHLGMPNNFSPTTSHNGALNCPVAYWSTKEIAMQGIREPFHGSEREAISKLDELLLDAVKLRMIADVPLGALLSGGIDSSTITALMQSQSDRPIKTFSIGFYDNDYNEAGYAKKVAAHLKTDHTELYVTEKHALEIIPRLPKWFDEPFADSSQIPSYLVSEMTRKYVTVALSGDGGDELFAGYNRYVWGKKIWRQLQRLPLKSRKYLARALNIVSPSCWDTIFKLIPKHIRPHEAGYKVSKLANILQLTNSVDVYRRLVTHWHNPETIIPGASEPHDSVIWDKALVKDIPDFTERMQYLDMVTYLPDDILTKVDRASMAVSLELRAPLIDHRLVEFSWQIPLSMKLKNGQSKWLLRQVLNKYVPENIIERPKTGFGVPIDSWLRGSLSEWAETLLNKKRLQEDGFFNYKIIINKWQNHISGKEACQHLLWNILMFQAWLDEVNG